MIHVIRTRATKQQYDEMLTKIILYIKVAVDVRQGILAGGENCILIVKMN